MKNSSRTETGKKVFAGIVINTTIIIVVIIPVLLCHQENLLNATVFLTLINVIGLINVRKYVKIKKGSFNVPAANTFSECIKDTAHKVPDKRVIHVRNEKIDQMKISF